MIPEERQCLRGGSNAKLMRPLIECRKYGASFAEGESEKEIKG